MREHDFHQNFSNFLKVLPINRNQEHDEQYSLESRLGEGSVLRFIPRLDLDIVISQYEFYRNHRLSIATKQPMIEVSFQLEGKRQIHVSGMEYEFDKNTATLQFMKEVEADFYFQEETSLLMLGIGIPVHMFDYFMNTAFGKSKTSFERVIGADHLRFFQRKLDPLHNLMINQLLQSIQNGTMTNLELESTALNLLSQSFREFLYDEPKRSEFSKADIEKIKLAKEIILSSMAEPPTLIELAKRIRLNDFKLKKGFKEMYGQTVFGYLREKRLEKALALLQVGQMNVNEVACAVGYANPSYFAEVFREKYGVNPSMIKN